MKKSTKNESIAGKIGCLMDLPGDCLLEIIDRLPFLDRLRFRVCGDQARFRSGYIRDWPRADYYLTLPLIDGGLGGGLNSVPFDWRA
ncbi:hypothetical protein PRIPAC_75227, partial [Pristionchus pacificus]|uniref:F-box domain-containing protein n=1 Tax=Pristionchus pacificus TaxID=54126 RepID=A0A2A6C904_PRIPA